MTMEGWFGDAWDLLAGKSQSWYQNVSKIQNQLAVVMAGVTAAGRDVWDAVAQASVGPTQDGSPLSGVEAYDTVLADIDQSLTAIVVTKSHVPSDAQIAQAAAVARKYQGELDFVSSVAPEVSAQIAQDQKAVAAMLPGPMGSPSAVGRAEFERQLEDRAKALGQGTFDLVKMLALGAGAVAVLMAMGKL